MTTKKHLHHAAAASGFATVGISAFANAYEAGSPGPGLDVFAVLVQPVSMPDVGSSKFG